MLVPWIGKEPVSIECTPISIDGLEKALSKCAVNSNHWNRTLRFPADPIDGTARLPNCSFGGCSCVRSDGTYFMRKSVFVKLPNSTVGQSSCGKFTKSSNFRSQLGSSSGLTEAHG